MTVYGVKDRNWGRRTTPALLNKFHNMKFIDILI